MDGLRCLGEQGVLTLSFVGLGQGSVVSPHQTLTLRRVPLQYAGAAGGILQTGQRIGTALGIAVITALFSVSQSAFGWTAAAVIAFGTIGISVVLSGMVATVDRAQERRGYPRSVA